MLSASANQSVVLSYSTIVHVPTLVCPLFFHPNYSRANAVDRHSTFSAAT
ncbi:hypothetical protein PspLS_06766 [Pyricularia sp. CBS 133598]|nr:hypothetical protein PspLS_06766 [Pyricularia sp. CBS 133598]